MFSNVFEAFGWMKGSLAKCSLLMVSAHACVCVDGSLNRKLLKHATLEDVTHLWIVHALLLDLTSVYMKSCHCTIGMGIYRCLMKVVFLTATCFDPLSSDVVY